MRPFSPGHRNASTPICNPGRVGDRLGYAGRRVTPSHGKCGIKSAPVLGNGLVACGSCLMATPGAWKNLSGAVETAKTVVFHRRVLQLVVMGRKCSGTSHSKDRDGQHGNRRWPCRTLVKTKVPAPLFPDAIPRALCASVPRRQYQSFFWHRLPSNCGEMRNSVCFAPSSVYQAW